MLGLFLQQDFVAGQNVLTLLILTFTVFLPLLCGQGGGGLLFPELEIQRYRPCFHSPLELMGWDPRQSCLKPMIATSTAGP